MSRSKLDQDLDNDLNEAYGVGVGIRTGTATYGYFKYCVVCNKMQHHTEESIAGIIDWVCKVCGSSPIGPVVKPVLRLVKRPKS